MARLFDPRKLVFGVTLAAGALLMAPVAPAEAQVQGRMRVLVPNFETENPRNSRQGQQVADQLRRAINQMNTHAPVEPKDVTAALRKHSLREGDMDCIKWRQLAMVETSLNVGLVLCGYITEAGQIEANFTPVGGGDPFEVPGFAFSAPDQVAQQIVQSFGTYIQQMSLVVYCNDYIQSQSWEQALDACNRAVELNPRSVSAQYARGSSLVNLDRPEEALRAFQTVLQLDPLNQDAMLHSGILATRLNQSDVAQRFFQSYLELNPGSEEVRLKVATDLANAGDPAGALKLVEAVLGPDASGTMIQYAGHFAMNAALKAHEAAGPASGTPSEEGQRFFQTAIRHYEAAIEKLGTETDPSVYSRMMQAYNRLGNVAKALEFGQRATQLAPDNAQTWAIYAQVLASEKRIDEAVTAFDRAAQLDPELPNLNAQKAVLFLEADRLNEAVAAVKAGLTRGDVSRDIAESLGQQMAVKGFQATQAGRLTDALPYYAAAREIGQSERTVAMINFFNGYTVLKQGEPIIKNGNNAAAGRQALPLFNRAKTMLESASAYTEQAATRAQLLQQVAQFIEVADALIKAGR